MSRNYNNQSSSIKAHCKVCQDAGKTESEYSSHFTRESRDPNSRVVCPTLLALNCKYCFQKGHTVKYCKELKKKERTAVHQLRRSEAPTKSESKGIRANTNIFIALDSEDEADDEPKENQVLTPEVQEQFPAMTASKPVLPQLVTTSYASVLARPFEAKAPESKTPVAPRQAPKAAPKAAPRLAPWASKVATTVPSKMNWADMDSDSEDEEYAEVEDNSAW